MSRALNNIRSLHNPLSLSGIGGLAVVRGTAFIFTGTGLLPLGGYNNVPAISCSLLVLMGTLWAIAGAFLWISMAVRRLFIAAVALMVGIYATSAIIHAVSIFTTGTWDGIVGTALFTMMVPVLISLATIEIDPPGEASISGEEAT